MQFHHQELKNGLQIIGETNPDARSVAVGFFVTTGARDETPEVSGVSHFLEHMVFKGTERRSALDVNRDFDVIGAHYNAFTSEENTVFYAAVLPEYLPQAVDILADILRPSLRPEDFDMEKNVILEEIGMYEDQPASSAYEAAKQTFFAKHPLGNSVLGTRTSVGALTRNQMFEYFMHRYTSPNITVVAAGNFEFGRLVRLVEERCAVWPGRPAPREPSPLKGTDAFRVIPKDKVVQEHMFLISAGPPAHDEQRYSAGILATVVGDDSGSRLYWALVDPGLAETADMDFHDFDHAGAFYTYLSGDAERTQQNLQVALDVFADVQRQGVTEEEVHQAKSKWGSRIVRASERPMGRMQALGFQWTYLRQYRTVDQELQSVDAVTTKSIRKVLDEYPLDRPAIVALGPLDQLNRPGTNDAK